VNKKNYLQILGCGASQGVPTSNGDWGACQKNSFNTRTRSSIFLKINNFNLLFDTSPDLRFQLFKNKILKIDYVFFTHIHADHIFGINDLRAFYLTNGKRINIFSTKETVSFLEKHFKYLFKNHKNYPAILKSNIIQNSLLIKNKISKIKIERIDVIHGSVKTIGFKIDNRIAYIPDVKTIPEKTIKKIKNIPFLIIDCFRFKKHNLHVNLEEVMAYVKKINPAKVFLTHMSKDIDYNFIKKKLKKFKNTVPCYDGMIIKI